MEFLPRFRSRVGWHKCGRRKPNHGRPIEQHLNTAAQDNRLLNFLSLFETLLCCALPSVLVLLEFGGHRRVLLSAVLFRCTVLTGALIGRNYLYSYRIAPHLKSTQVRQEHARLMIQADAAAPGRGDERKKRWTTPASSPFSSLPNAPWNVSGHWHPSHYH